MNRPAATFLTWTFSISILLTCRGPVSPYVAKPAEEVAIWHELLADATRVYRPSHSGAVALSFGDHKPQIEPRLLVANMTIGIPLNQPRVVDMINTVVKEGGGTESQAKEMMLLWETSAPPVEVADSAVKSFKMERSDSLPSVSSGGNSSTDDASLQDKLFKISRAVVLGNVAVVAVLIECEGACEGISIALLRREGSRWILVQRRWPFGS